MTNSKSIIPRDQLARLITEHLDGLKVSREQAAKLVGDHPTQMSRLYQGHLEEFSSERLIRMLVRLGYNVQILVSPSANGVGFHTKVDGTAKQGRVRVSDERGTLP